MASFADRTEVALVGVVVTWRAIGERQTGVARERVAPWIRGVFLLDLRVTTDARDGFVFAGQGITGFCVIEPWRRLPAVVSVTVQAVVGQLSTMLIGMTRKTLVVQPEKRPIEIDLIAEASKIIADETAPVTIAALESRMLSLQIVARLTVVKLIDPARPVYQLKFPTRVFVVALEARFGLDRRHTVVIPAFIVDAHGDLVVTIETFVRAGTRSQVVAFEAISYAIQTRMWLCQLARRYLR